MDIEKLGKIISKINAGEDSTHDFGVYLESVNKVPYSKDSWPVAWRKKVYEFGSLFSRTDAAPYLRILNNVKEKSLEKEVFDFIYSEVIWNFFEQNNDYIKDEFRDLLKKYPTNPEFHHSYAHYLENNKNYEQAIFESKTAYRIDSTNQEFVISYFGKTKAFFDFLLSKNRLDDASVILGDAEKFSDTLFGVDQWEMSHRVSSMRDRLHDYRALERKVDFFEKDIQNTIKIEQRRLIEILGIFSAIIAFILTNITISVGNLTPRQALFLMIGMAVVLMIFVFSISFLFGPKYRHANWWWFITRPKLWVIIVLFVLLVGMFCVTLKFPML